MHVEHARGKQQPILLETVITSKRINISQIIVMIETGCKAIMLLVSCPHFVTCEIRTYKLRAELSSGGGPSDSRSPCIHTLVDLVTCGHKRV